MQTHPSDVIKLKMPKNSFRFTKKGLGDVAGVHAVLEEFEIIIQIRKNLCLKSKNLDQCHVRGVHTTNEYRLIGVLLEVCTLHLACSFRSKRKTFKSACTPNLFQMQVAHLAIGIGSG